MTKLFVVGFPREMDELQLAQLFGPYGDIDLITILKDKVSGKSKGYGFIQMKTEGGANDAIKALHGFAFGERQMEVRIAEDKPVLVAAKLSQPAKISSPIKKKRPRLSR